MDVVILFSLKRENFRHKMVFLGYFFPFQILIKCICSTTDTQTYALLYEKDREIEGENKKDGKKIDKVSEIELERNRRREREKIDKLIHTFQHLTYTFKVNKRK